MTRKLLGAIYDLDEVRLQRCSTHQESVDVRHGVQLVAILSSCGASVNNSSLSGYFRRDVSSQPLTNIRVCLKMKNIELLIHLLRIGDNNCKEVTS